MSHSAIDQQFQLAMQLHQSGQLPEAQSAYEQVLSQHPGNADALHYLGILMSQIRRHDRGVELINKAISIKPHIALFHNNLGTVLKNSGKLNEAISAYRHSIEINPNDPLAHSNLGNTLCDAGKPQEAVEACRQALKLQPEYAEAHTNLGNALSACGNQEEALAAYRRAVQINPLLPESQHNLGNALTDAGLLDDAVAAYRNAIRLNPTAAASYMALGFALASQGLSEEAFENYSRSVALDPGNAKNRSFLVFAAHYLPEIGPRKIYELACEWANLVHTNTPEPHTHYNERSPDRKLKIGYVSPDFRDFMGSLMMPIFEHHDSSRFEVHCFSSTTRPDSVTTQIRNIVSGWHDVGALSDFEMAEVIWREQIDILVDLALHTTGNRLAAFASKPAPVQVSYLAYFGTSGLQEMDYVLCDRYLAPDDRHDDCFTERKLRLPRSYWCFRPNPQASTVGSLPAVVNGYVTFGCLNNLAKVNIKVVEAWIKILLAVSSSKLLLAAPEGSARQRIHHIFQHNGVATDRVQFVPPKLKYTVSLPRIDISLDPFPFGGGGGNTTCEALWMGVPVVKLAGITGVSRGGISALCNLGLSELIAETTDQYIHLAVELATNLPRLSKLRSTLRQRMKDSPLMDEKAYVAGLESAYRLIWRNWCEGQR